MADTGWRLDAEPRQYRRMTDQGKWTWCVEGSRARIASVTTVLGEDSGLQNWAVGRTVAAAHQAARTWYGADEDSLLGFGRLAELTGEMPDQIRDRAAAVGTAAHSYLSDKLTGGDWDCAVGAHVPYGLRSAIDDFLDDYNVRACTDEHGPRVERAVGDALLGVAGTYDAQVMLGNSALAVEVHRIDLKTSKSIRPSHLAQLAAYEALAVSCGEMPSEYLTLVHADNFGLYRMYSIAVGSPAHREALDYFNAALRQRKAGAALGKLLR